MATIARRRLRDVRTEIVDLVPARARRVLDLGCSTGWLGAALKERGDVEVVGIERDPGLRRGGRASVYDRVVVADVEDVPDGPRPLRLPGGRRRARAPRRPVDGARRLRRDARARLPGGRLAPQRRPLDHLRARSRAGAGRGGPRASTTPPTCAGSRCATRSSSARAPGCASSTSSGGPGCCGAAPGWTATRGRWRACRRSRSSTCWRARRMRAHEPHRHRSSRPTTSAASTGRRSTATWPSRSGARSCACSPTCTARTRASCASASAATCACRRPSWPRATATGWSPRARTCSTPAQVGTEMLYFLVGSQDLDGGLMCTASHNPAKYTGAKLVERGAVALSGDGGIGEIRDLIEAGLGDAPGGGNSEDVDVGDEFREAALKFIDASRDQAAEGGRRRRQRHGRADGRPAARAARARPRDDLLDARRQLPRPRAEPAAGGEPPLHHRQGPRGGRRPRHRLGRRRRPLLLHRRHRRVRRRRLPDGAAGRVDPREAAGRRHPLRRPRLAARSRTWSSGSAARPT